MCDDSVAESDESFTLRINPGAGYVVGTQSETVVTIRDNEPPGAPTVLRVVPGDTTLNLSWTAPAGTVTGYDVQYKLSTASTWISVNRSGTEPRDLIENVTNDTAYDVRVRAKNANGNSAWVTGSGTPTVTPLVLSGLTVSDGANDLVMFPHAFHKDFIAPVFNFLVKVAPGARTVTVTPTWTGSGSVTVASQDSSLIDGVQYVELSSATVATSGAKSDPLRLASRGGTRLVVTASNGSVYHVTVVRAGDWASADDYLRDIQLRRAGGGGTGGDGADAFGTAGAVGRIALDRPFDDETYAYGASVPNEVTRVRVSPRASHPSARLTVNDRAPDEPVGGWTRGRTSSWWR